jgi:hypothetical protein
MGRLLDMGGMMFYSMERFEKKTRTQNSHGMDQGQTLRLRIGITHARRVLRGI